MRKFLSLVLSLSVILGIAGVPVQGARGIQYAWIECETSSTVISGDYKTATDVNASGGASLTLDSETEPVDHRVAVNFTLSNADNYDIYILGTPGTSGWSSSHKWRLDGEEEYQADTAADYISTCYVVAGVRGVGIGWHKLTTAQLDRGVHTLEFMVDKKRPQNDFAYDVLDTVLVVPADWGFVPVDTTTRPFDKSSIQVSYVSGSVSAQTVRPEETVEVTVGNRSAQRTAGSPKLFVSLVYQDEDVCRATGDMSTPLAQRAIGQEYMDTLSLTVPFNAPSGRYEVRTGLDGIPYADGSDYAVVGEITVDNGQTQVEVTPYTAEISNVVAPAAIEKGKRFQVTADVKWGKELDFDTTGYVALWKDDILYKVMEGEAKLDQDAETITLNVVQDEDLPDDSYDVQVGIHQYKTTQTERPKVTTSGANPVRVKYYKPLSNGSYTAYRDGKEIFWYVDQTGTAIYSGEPYIPMGGMFVFLYISAYSDDQAANKANLEQDLKDLAEFEKRGVKDLYINPVRSGNSVPVWAWQYLLDILEDRGWNYGLQINPGVTQTPTKAYYPHATDKVDPFVVHNVTQSGEVSVTSTKDFSQIFMDAVDSLYTVIDPADGSVVDSGKGTLKLDADGNLVYGANVTIPAGRSCSVYFTPNVLQTWGEPLNFFDDAEQYYAEIEKFSSKLRCGSHFRLFVDPTKNELGIYNNYESARFANDSFNQQYAGWLETKYGTVDKLNAAWKTEKPIASFQDAALYIPVYTAPKDENNDSFTVYVHMNTGEANRMDTHLGVSWNDYLDGRDDLFLQVNIKAADCVKKYTDLPVIYKHCSVQRRYFINPQIKGGFDGMGSEAYGAYNRAKGLVGTATSEVAQFARTGWTIVTETNTSEDIMHKYGGDLFGYPDQESLNQHMDSLLAGGAKGFYDFLLCDRFDKGFEQIYSQIHLQKPMEYMSEYVRNVTDERRKEIASKKYLEETFAYYPAGMNWWYPYNERGCVQLQDDTMNFKFLTYDAQAPKNIVQTNDVYVDSRLLFINIQDGPYSTIFGPDVSALLQNQPVDKRVCVIGHRNDLGAIPEIDRYYTAEKVAISEDETVQILKPTPTSTVLKTTEDGKPWALKDGEFYIIASDNMQVPDGKLNEVQYIKYAEELGVTDVSHLENLTEESVPQAGFADMEGHWAQSDVEAMRRQGIASGVGGNCFAPERDITRAEYVALIVRGMGYETVPYRDAAGIDKTAWYADTMQTAWEQGILPAEFLEEADRPVTRQEMAQVAALVMDIEQPAFDLSVYTDQAEITDPAAVQAVSQAGVMYGMDDGSFAPANNATRAQAVVIIRRLLQVKGK